MKIINIIIKNTVVWLILSAVALFTISCSENLSDLNISPNELSDKDVDIKFVLTNIITKSSKIHVGLVYNGGDIPAATQYLQRDMTSYEENNYVWGTEGFGRYYEPIKDSEYIFGRAETEKEGAEKNYYQAVSLIMKSYWYGFMTSAFGDIPYSKAMQGEQGGEEFFKPVYDAQEDVFKGVLEDLKTANELLKTVTVCESAISVDVMYHGDGLMWRKFANSLCLRFYLRLSDGAGISSIVGNANEYPLMEDNTDNAVVDFLGSDRYNSWPGGPLNWSLRSEFYRRKPSSTIIDKLISLNDPRLTTWIRPVDVQILQGTGTKDEYVMENGFVKRYTINDIDAANSDGDMENNISTALYVGLAVALNSPDDYNLGGDADKAAIAALDADIYRLDASNPHLSYLADIYAENSNALVKSILMNCAEVDFILAEASEYGWIGGNAYDYYTSGIEKSFRQYEIKDGVSLIYDANNYKHVIFNKAEYFANAETIYNSASDKLVPILDQKWIALWMTPESWFDWRRTGLPNLTKNIIAGTKGQNIPLRFPYDDPYNETNMLDAIEKLVPPENDQWSKMWLIKGH